MKLFLAAAFGILLGQDPPKKDQDPAKDAAPAKQDAPKKDEAAPKKDQDTPKKDQDAPKKDTTPPAKKEEKKKENPVLSKLNEARKLYSLDPVEEDEAFSDGCRKHAEYLLRNNPGGGKENRFDENARSPGYTKEGKATAAKCVIGFDGAEKAVEFWMASFIQRLQILDPGLAKVGYGQVGRIVVLDVQSGKTTREFEPILSPREGDSAVDTRFGIGGDYPDPLPRSAKFSEVGYPVTVYFPAGLKVHNVSWKLKDKAGKAIQCYTSMPEGAAVRYDRVVHQAIALIPKSHLAYNTEYIVTVKCMAGDKPFEKTWSFTTAK